MEQGDTKEREYYIARFVLHKLAANRFDDAHFVFLNYKKLYKTPLMHFLGNN